jgi:hypothetical protein
MAYENIQIQHGNFTIDRSGSAFYTMNHSAGTMIKKSANGTVIQTYTLATIIKEVLSLQFDGYYYWSLEQPVVSGFRVRKWEIGTDDLVRVVDDYLYTVDPINTYEVNSIAVESYADSLDNQETIGTTMFDLNDGSVVVSGDDIIVGPSTSIGFEGLFSFATVIGKVGSQITINNPLEQTFSPNDPIVFTRDFFAFSDTAPGNLEGALYRYKASTGAPLALDVSNLYGGVTASTFFKNKLMFIRGSEVIWLNIDSLTIFKSQAIDNATKDRAGYVDTFDLAGFSETLYRLEQEHVYYNDGFDRYDSENWFPLFNYNTNSTLPEIYFVALKAHPQVLHRSVAGMDPEDLKAEVVVTVLDQFRTPVFNRVVDFTSDGGPLSSIQETTDSNGQVRVTYTADAFEGDVVITAEVT